MAYLDLIDGNQYYQGQVVTAEEATILSGTNAQAAILTFGLGLVRGASDDLLVLPDGTGGVFMGVALASDSIEKRSGYSLDANGDMGWPSDYTVSYVRRGLVAVPVDSDCVQGGPVYLIHTASSGQVPGHFRKDANTDQADLVPNAVFWKTLTAAGLGLVRFNLA